MGCLIFMDIKGRKKDIYNYLCEKERVSVSTLAKQLYVSEMTIRRDLDEMEKMGLIKRYRGGALLIDSNNYLPFPRRFYIDEEEKKILCKKAAEHLKDNITVFIDSSSTSCYILPHIVKFKGIRIITNSINALLTANKLNIPCILIGGECFIHDMCFVGSIAEQYACQFNIDIAFFSARGISKDGTVSDDSVEQSSIRKIIMKNSKQNIFMFEKSKLNKSYFYKLCTLKPTDILIKP